jgi:hypothetical protein
MSGSSTGCRERWSSSPLGRRACGASRFWWRTGLGGGVLLRLIPCRAVHGGHGAARRVMVGGNSWLGEMGGGYVAEGACHAVDTRARRPVERKREDRRLAKLSTSCSTVDPT